METLATKTELKAEQDKIVKLETYDLSYFLVKMFFDGDGPQNVFVYQGRWSCYSLIELYSSALSTQYTHFVHSIKFSSYQIGIKYEDPLVVERSNYATKILNAGIVYELDTWSKIPRNYFKLKKNACLVPLI